LRGIENRRRFAPARGAFPRHEQASKAAENDDLDLAVFQIPPGILTNPILTGILSMKKVSIHINITLFIVFFYYLPS
jgi:hypothetical protein